MKNKLLCIDVSHYEPAVNWEKAKAAGVVLMHTKASDGVVNVDKTLWSHTLAAKRAGVLIGAYHFFRASRSGEEQAKHFLKTLGAMKLDAPPVFDWEDASAEGMSPIVQKARALNWLHEVEKATGRVPMIYGGESYLHDLKLGAEFEKYPLWVAHYTTDEKRIKLPTPWKQFTMWQYTDAESVPGLASGHHVDASWFNGTIDDLKKLCQS